MDKTDLEQITKLLQEKIQSSLEKSGKLPVRKTKKEEPVKKQEPLNEAVVVMADSFVLKTEKMSKRTMESHQVLYKKYVDTFNKVSAELDGVNKHEANSYSSMYRSLKIDECSNLNAIKLHELYFHNISDLASEIGVDSLPYMKFSRNFGTFEDWQFDFMAAAMAAKEGWAITVYEPFNRTYMNIVVDGDNVGLPIGAIPVLVIDMWSHAFFRDYEVDKKSYLISMMREINWDVVEARMVLAERSELGALYQIAPIYNDEPNKMLDKAEQALEAPVTNVKDVSGNHVSPSNPAAPESIQDQDRMNRGY